MNLAEFLLARIAEEDAARENSVYYSMPHPVTGKRIQWGTDDEVAQTKVSHWWLKSVAECEAKRLLVTTWAEQAKGSPDDGDWGDDMVSTWLGDAAKYYLAVFALPYVDHPEFDPAWRTEETA